MSELMKLFTEGVKKSAVSPSIHGYRPHESQVKFHKSTAMGRLYIGGNRSGKTVGGATESVWRLLGRHPYQAVPPPPVRGRISCVDLNQGINQVTLPEIARWIPPSELKNGSWDDSYSKSARSLELDNGSTLEWLTYEQTKDQHAGTSRHFVWFDEEPDQDIFNEDLLRLVDTNGKWWATMTPINGMTWVYYRYWQPIMLEGIKDPNTDIFQVNTTENPHISETVLDAITSGLSEEEKLARRTGRFMAMSGLIYSTFNEDRHVIDERDPREFRNQMIVMALDHGFRNPTAILYGAIDFDGILTIFHEHYQTEWTVDQHAAYVRDFERATGLQPVYRIADPAISQRSGITNTSIHEEYGRNGVPLALGVNDVKIGVDRVRWYIDNDRLRITRNCRNLIKELRTYRWATYASSKMNASKQAKEAPNKVNDHACDALRYLIVSRPLNDTGHDPTPDYSAVARALGATPAIDPLGPLSYEDLDFQDNNSYHVILGEDW